MMKLTPIVKNILLLNVVVFVALLIANQQPNLQYLYNDYFSLHKPPSFVRTTVNIGGTPYFLPPGLELTDGTRLTADNAQNYIDASPGLQEQFKKVGRSLKANQFKPLQIITHFFSHSLTSLFHIIFNMFVLASFGPILEMVMGQKRFLVFYLFCGVIGGILISLLDPSVAPVVGASGAIFGVMVAFAMYFPKQKLSIMFLPFGFEARWFVPAIGIISLVFVVLQYMGIEAGGPISHFGHLAGMVAAVLFFYAEKYLPFRLDSH